MSRLVATLFISLDGVVEAPDKWSFPYWNDEIAKFKFEETFASDALLLGRVTHEGFAAAWPSRKDPEGFADRFNSMPQTRRLQDPEETRMEQLTPPQGRPCR